MNTVTNIAAARGNSRKAGDDALHTVTLPGLQPTGERLKHAIDQAGLAYDARAIWLGYPNMLVAAERLVELLSLEWPSRQAVTQPAAIAAVLVAIRRVKEGMGQNEVTREMIVANFLHGLATVVNDVVGVSAWGYQKERPVEQYDATKGNFADWSRAGDFTEVRFYFAEELSQSEVEGTRLKLLCAVASAKDVGIAARFKK